jgi:hypothetical protein
VSKRDLLIFDVEEDLSRMGQTLRLARPPVL